MKKYWKVFTNLYPLAATGWLLIPFSILAIASAAYHWKEGAGDRLERVFQRADEWGMYLVMLSLIAHFSGQPLVVQLIFVVATAGVLIFALDGVDSFVLVPLLLVIATLYCSLGWYIIVFAVAGLLRLVWENEVIHGIFHLLSSLGFWMMLH